jgi:hypothetical protein
MWEIAENLHRLDLTKDQRDEHIRRYAELLQQRSQRQVPQDAAPVLSDGRKSGKRFRRKLPHNLSRNRSKMRRFPKIKAEGATKASLAKSQKRRA